MKLEVAPLERFPRGRGLKVSVGEDTIAMFRIDDTVFAIGDRCSHAEASLAEGEVFDGHVECPRHGSEFDLMTGAPASLPATKPVPTYEVTVEDGVVFIHMEDR
jgi:3-phenylpropionate/trans-cinnamate dioxygenase ferredoxin subunit